jgi:hypothetical protein
MERPDQTERRISFNPEAAAFSPTTASIRAANAFAAASGHDGMEILGDETSALLCGTSRAINHIQIF